MRNRTWQDYDFYAILGIAQTATNAEITDAFKQKLNLWHPDRHKDASPEAKESANHWTKVAIEARRVLLNPSLRASYDRQLTQRRQQETQTKPPGNPNRNQQRRRESSNPYRRSYRPSSHRQQSSTQGQRGSRDSDGSRQRQRDTGRQYRRPNRPSSDTTRRHSKAHPNPFAFAIRALLALAAAGTFAVVAIVGVFPALVAIFTASSAIFLTSLIQLVIWLFVLAIVGGMLVTLINSLRR